MPSDPAPWTLLGLIALGVILILISAYLDVRDGSR
jgi:hypothetical protein